MKTQVIETITIVFMPRLGTFISVGLDLHTIYPYEAHISTHGYTLQ